MTQVQTSVQTTSSRRGLSMRSDDLFFLLCHQATLLKVSTVWRWTHYYGRRLRGLRYLVAGPRLIDEGYSQAKGKTFVVPTPSNDCVLVTSNGLIKELTEAPPGLLSLHAVAKEMLQPKYTMRGFEWRDQRGVEGTGFVRALRSLLTSHLPHFQPSIDTLIRDSLVADMSPPGKDGFSSIRLFPTIKRIVTKVNSYIFFGEQLSENVEFTTAALEFPQVVIFAAEILRITPGFLRPKYLESIVKQRMATGDEWNRERSATTKPTYSGNKVDCIQWIIDTSPRKNPWSPQRMVGEIMAVWFSTVHQLAMTATYLVQDLCLHAEYMEPLRNELREHLEYQAQTGAPMDVERMPLLDSFIKESIRCSNVDAISCRRKALSHYVLKDGSTVEKGDWVCIPQLAMMHDAQRYSNPEAFRPFRFAEANSALREGHGTSLIPDKTPTSLTTATVEWPIWGLGIAACPGRFYASLVLKLLVIQILEEWECKLSDIRGSQRGMVWRSSIVPRSDTVVLFRPRPDGIR
ncbi:cytochrome P450 [Nemania abortiva]|nr:cytochrome P450 [Nemania abortiva]